jgi:hypothetical protein
VYRSMLLDLMERGEVVASPDAVNELRKRIGLPAGGVRFTPDEVRAIKKRFGLLNAEGRAVVEHAEWPSIS